jgi:hypothetical protein
MEFDGMLVSELGVKKYLVGYNAKKHGEYTDYGEAIVL